MKRACLYLTDILEPNQNRIFEYHIPYNILKELFKKKGYDLSTQDINKPEKSEIIIYSGKPREFPVKDHSNSYLFLYECEVIHPYEWLKENHKPYKKIFTWNDEIIDNKKYFKFNFPQSLIDKIKIGLDHKNKFCTLISENKMSSHKLELYSERIKTIRYFEQNHPDEFELYGRGWDKPINYIRGWTEPRPDQVIEYYPSYKGEIKDKRAVLEEYKFSICYENARDIQGYITEKIFDCFASGCVPVYWGASNITDHIPAECFIDKRKFDNYDDLYSYLKNMSDEEYINYQVNIQSYLNSDKVYQFSAKGWTEMIIKGIFLD